MRPLRDIIDPSSPIEAAAVDLLRSAAPSDVVSGAKQRVRARLLQHPVVRTRRLFRPALVIPVILLCAGSGAALGRSWIADGLHAFGRSFFARQDPTRAPADSQRFSGRASVEKIPTLAKDSQSEANLAAEAALATRPESFRGKENRVGGISSPGGLLLDRRLRQRPTGKNGVGFLARSTFGNGIRLGGATTLAMGDVAAPVGGQANRPPAGTRPQQSGIRQTNEDTDLVFDAMRALRQDGHPGRAQILLDEYMRRNPEGALSEEALALSVEAAAARRDPRAEELVDQYLTRYPAGHFRAVVERARARLSP